MNHYIIEKLSETIKPSTSEEKLSILIDAYEQLEDKKKKCNKNQILAINFIDNWSDAIQHNYFSPSEPDESCFINMACEIIEALNNNSEITNGTIINTCQK